MFITDVIEAREKKKNIWSKWFGRLGGFFDQKFGGPDGEKRTVIIGEKRLKRFPGNARRLWANVDAKLIFTFIVMGRCKKHA